MKLVDYSKMTIDEILDSSFQMTDGGRIDQVKDLYTTFNHDVDLEALKKGGYINLIGKMMEPVLGKPDKSEIPDPYGPEVMAWWAKRGIVKELHGTDKPMDWAAFEKKTGYHMEEGQFVIQQNKHKLWVSFVPASAFGPDGKDKKLPVVFVLHGAGNNISLLDGWGYVEEATRRGWIAIVPSLELADVLEEILEEAKTLYPVDESRVYACGFSFGGMSSNRLGNERPDLFAAVGPCGAAIDNSFSEGRTGRGEPMPPFDGNPRGLQLGIKMPVINVYGSLDGNRFPFYDFQPGDRPMFRLKGPKDLVDATNSWCRVNDVPEIDYDAVMALKGRDDISIEEKHIGIPLLPENRSTVTIGGVQHNIADLRSRDGIVRTKLVCMWGLPHWPSPEMVRQIMDFFSHFSRDPITKASVYHP